MFAGWTNLYVDMITNTKALFVSLLKAGKADCVCDIGSRDGIQSLLFRHLLPRAVVMAFEANPINFEMMQKNQQLRASHIDLYPYAITDSNGTATFHITDVDYSNPEENRGTSSLLVHEGLKVLRSVDVPTRRIDDIIVNDYPGVMNIGLWIDVEGAEYGVLDGMKKIKDRVMAVHVETARTPMRIGQKTFSQVVPLMEAYGFALCGSNIDPESTWGDVVFVNQRAADALGHKLWLCRARASVNRLVKVDRVAVFLKAKCPAIYRLLRYLYIKLWA